MSKIPASKLIASVESAMGWPYVSPGSNGPDGIDCSGLLVYAYEQNGASIYHGSNTIYRKCCRDCAKLTSEKQLVPGMVVFKWNANTPKKFNDGLGDFQHIGVVTHVKPLRIVHASSAAGKVIADTKLGKWKYCGYLKAVDYGDTGGEQPMQEYVVHADNGKPVRVREQPYGMVSDQLKVGTHVMAEAPVDGWQEIHYNGKAGYMMEQFLKPADAAPATPTDLGGGAKDSTSYKTLSMAEYNRLCEARDILISIVGVG